MLTNFPSSFTANFFKDMLFYYNLILLYIYMEALAEMLLEQHQSFRGLINLQPRCMNGLVGVQSDQRS